LQFEQIRTHENRIEKGTFNPDFRKAVHTLVRVSSDSNPPKSDKLTAIAAG